MAPSVDDLVSQFKNSLGPFVKPRDDVAFIRRILTLYLASLLPVKIVEPLAMTDTSSVPKPDPVLHGCRRDLLIALNANTNAKEEFELARQKLLPAPQVKGANTSGRPPLDGQFQIQQSKGDSILMYRLAISKLKQKVQRLQIIEKNLVALTLLAPNTPDFLSSELLARDSAATPLPEVPSSIVSGVGMASVQRNAVRGGVNDLLDSLEKKVMYSKLILKKEENALSEVKSPCTGSCITSRSPEARDLSSKMRALTATRHELISWIENELSNAGDDVGSGQSEHEDSDTEGSTGCETKPPPPCRTPSGRLHKGIAKMRERKLVEVRLRDIREKYLQYTELRRNVVVMLQRKPTLLRTVASMEGYTGSKKKQMPSLGSAPQAHLVTPYLASCLRLSREQKSLIQLKSHVNVQLSQAARNMAAAIDRIGDESQLLPRFPIPKQLENLEALVGENVGGSSAAVPASSSLGVLKPTADTLKKAQCWRHAATEAKLATLELVAEGVEEGQLALENANVALGEAEVLVGFGKADANTKSDATAATPAASVDEDIWLQHASDVEPGTARSGFGFGQLQRAKKHKEKYQLKSGLEKMDIWAQVDGNLGCLNTESP